MATELNRKVKRRVYTRRGEPLVVTLTAEGVYLREAGRRTAFLVEYGFAYQIGAKMAAEAARAQRKAARKAKREARR